MATTTPTTTNSSSSKPRTTPTTHSAYLRGRLARASLLTPADAAAYLGTLDHRASTAYVLGAEDDLGAPLRSPAAVEADVDRALGGAVARISTGSSVLRIELGHQLDRLGSEERDARTAGVALSAAGAVREEPGSVTTQAIATGCAVRLGVVAHDRERLAAQLMDVARVSVAVAAALRGEDLGADVEPEAPASNDPKPAASRPISPRVRAILDDLGVSVSEYQSSSNEPHVVAARRAVVLTLVAEGCSTRSIVEATGLAESTIHAHRRAHRAGAAQ